MATQAHCAFCFETLSANFEHRQPLSLSQVEELWQRYHAGNAAEEDAGSEEGLDSEEVEGEDDDDADMTDADGDAEQPQRARPAAVLRLIDRANTSSAASSSTSLPSTKSTASSTRGQRDASGAETPASSSSSRSSLFSFSKKQRSGGSKAAEFPLFVTWNTISRSGYKNLRGCIGTFEAQELEYGLRSYALTSAFEDVRFQPIPASLLPSLDNHITLLTNFSQPTKDPMDWTLGTHGIRISFTQQGRRYGATYLPDVAKEQGWTKEETLVSLMRKAGWNGGSGAWLRTWRDGKGELVRYEGKQVGLRYDEWKTWRDWVGELGVKSKELN